MIELIWDDGYVLKAKSNEKEIIRNGHEWRAGGLTFASRAMPEWVPRENLLYMWGSSSHRDSVKLLMTTDDAKLIKKALIILNIQLGFLDMEPEEWEV